MQKISEKKVEEIIKDLNKYKSLNNKKHQAAYYYKAKNNIVNSEELSTELIKKFLDIYSKCKKNVSIEKVETDDRAVTEVERDESGKIQYYKFEIFRKDSPTLSGKLDRKEMETIFRLYSTYGANLTQKIVSREFPQYTFIEFKRILRAFDIYKANSEFALHLIEEKSEEELINLHNQNKENNVLRRIEKDQLSEANKLINKLVRENQDIKNQLNNINNIKVDFKNFETGIYIPGNQPSDMSAIIHLSDLHIGSKCESNTLYPNKWDKEELERRLEVLADKIYEFGYLDILIINLLGDNLDGMDGQTARRDHIMPQNMDNMEQVTTFIEVMTKFIHRIRNFANKVKIYSVKEGNHDGITGYVASLALMNIIQRTAPEIECVLFKDFIGQYDFKGHKYLICHGKDSKFMKRGLPLNLDEKSKVMIYEWLEANNLHGEDIHFIKGDLHSNSLSSCKRFDYRNVLSLFGASDYSNYNFSRNSYGCSYDLFIGNTRTIGTFENFLIMTMYNQILKELGIPTQTEFNKIVSILPPFSGLGTNFSYEPGYEDIETVLFNYGVLKEYPHLTAETIDMVNKLVEIGEFYSLEELEKVNKILEMSGWTLSNYQDEYNELKRECLYNEKDQLIEKIRKSASNEELKNFLKTLKNDQ